MIRAFLVAVVLIALASCTQAHDASALPSAADAAPPALQLPNLGQPRPGIYTSGRVAAGDLAAIEAAGITRVIDFSRDSETPAFDEAAAMRSAGVEYHNLPIAGADDLTRDRVEAFDRLLSDATGPVLVHCASSNRVGAMAALRAAWIEGKPVDEAIAVGRAWGLKSLEDAVRERLAPGG